MHFADEARRGRSRWSSGFLTWPRRQTSVDSQQERPPCLMASRSRRQVLLGATAAVGGVAAPDRQRPQPAHSSKIKRVRGRPTIATATPTRLARSAFHETAVQRQTRPVLACHDRPVRTRSHLAARQGHGRHSQKGPVRRGRASYDGRPYADMVVLNENGQWFVRLAGMTFGPCATRKQAIDAAIGTAQLAERNGKTARVQEQIGPADFTLHWPWPGKPRRRSR
jgi:hypothetical protein